MTEIGIIFHWGIYSVPAFSISKTEGNGSEWYLKRLTESGNFRPISGWQETQEYHNTNFKNISYDEFSDLFLCQEWNCQEWIDLAKKVNAKYVILTAKHHDGFCLWNTKTTDNNSCQKGPKRDLVKEFCEVARKNNLKVGIYYSWSEFGKRMDKKYLDKILIPQVEELMTYNPEIWWFDGNWEIKTQIAQKTILNLVNKIKKSAIVNDRIYSKKNEDGQKLASDLDYLGLANYRVYGDRGIPVKEPKVKWEWIGTIGNSWGANKQENNYKSGKQLFEIYKLVRDKKGNFLINLGPLANGKLVEQEVSSLLELGTYIN